MKANLIVRAVAGESGRDAFDQWYEAEHLPDATAAFNPVSARRCWSDVTSGVHLAIYEFSSLARARAIASSDAIEALIAEFDRVWQGRVTRSREVVEICQSL